MDLNDKPSNIVFDDEEPKTHLPKSNFSSPEINKVRETFDAYKQKLVQVHELNQSADLIELIVKDLSVELKQYIPANNLFTHMSNQILNKLITIFLTENDELINKIILQDVQDIVSIELTDIESIPSDQELQFTKELAKQIELEENEQTEPTEQITESEQEFNDIDRLYAILFKFEELVSEDTIDIKNLMVYMIKFGIIKNKALEIIINNSTEVEKDLENTGLNSISVSNMFNAVKEKISQSEYDILFKNVKYYTIKYS